MFKSLRWKFLSWFTVILLLVVVGFASTQYLLLRHSRLGEIDAQLYGLAQVLVAKLEVMSPRRPRGFPGNPGSRGPDRPGGGRQEYRGPPRGGSYDRLMDQLEIPESFLERFGDDQEGTPYFAVWRPGGEIVKQSNMPPDFPRPQIRDRSRRQRAFSIRQREEFREIFASAPRGMVVVVGRSVEKVLAELNRLLGILFGTGVGVLALGLVGGWFLAGRAIKPIRTISAAAESISASNLSRRIDIESTENELGQLATVLNTTFDRLQRAFEQQARFTGDASHELRTPVSVILAQTAMARRKDRSAEEYKEVIEACFTVAQRMKSLVDGLLTLARTDAGDVVLRSHEFNLHRTVEECARMVESLAAERGISIRLELATVEFKGDPDRITQVITNLLTNAIRYNNEGGSVSVSLEALDSEVVLKVSDTGIGIPGPDVERIFERFYRIDKARSRKAGGSGLGLAIARAVVDAHGGTISCDSEPGDGSTFTVRFPTSAPGSTAESRFQEAR